MMRRITITAVVLVITSIALGQNYRRSKSPTPTPTPTPMPSTQFQEQANRQWPTTTSPTTTGRGPARSVQSIPATSPASLSKTTPIPRIATGQVPARSVQSLPPPTSAFAQSTPTPVPAPDIKTYVDRQAGGSNDGKFHLTVNGKDLALAPFHVWRQTSTGVNTTSTCVDMRSPDGRVYDIDFLTTGTQVTGVRIHKINGEVLRQPNSNR